MTRHTALAPYAAVFVGGVAGSLGRALADAHLPPIAPLSSTFVVNVLASLLLGWLVAARHRLHSLVLPLGAIGFCGGLSTFSSFAAEIVVAARSGGVLAASLAPALEIATGLLAGALGLALGGASHRSPRR